MTTAEETYHKALHEQINKSLNLSDWIYHDMRLDCDGQAVQRTADRFASIQEEWGNAAVYGVAAGWCLRTADRVDSSFARKGLPSPAIKAVLEESVELSTLDTMERAYISAKQFVATAANDDLEMAEAIFNAAAASSDEDMTALVVQILLICLELSYYAKANKLT